MTQSGSSNKCQTSNLNLIPHTVGINYFNILTWIGFQNETKFKCKFLEEIRDSTAKVNQPFQCAYCRIELTEEPSDYKVCRLARELRQQVIQLRSALTRRSTIKHSTIKQAPIPAERLSKKRNSNELK